VSSILEKLMIDKMPEFSNKYQVVYDVLNPNVIHELSMEPVQNLRTSKDELIIVTTGRLVPPKGYDIAVNAASLLKRFGLNFKWYIIGDGPERINIEKWKQEMEVDSEVILLGEQKNPYAFMSQSDIYVQTSKFEGFGMTIGEAKILGKPIVSTNFDVVYNQLTHEVNGLISNMNGESVAENILRIIQDSSLREFIIENIKTEKNETSISELAKVEKLIDLQ
jgi:glycosyltransferase involved in cell wall biosynthesis